MLFSPRGLQAGMKLSFPPQMFPGKSIPTCFMLSRTRFCRVAFNLIDPRHHFHRNTSPDPAKLDESGLAGLPAFVSQAREHVSFRQLSRNGP